MRAMSQAPSPYRSEDRQRWREALLDKGGQVATLIEAILAGKEVDLADFELTQTDKQKEPPEKRLRRFFDLLMKRLRAVDDPRFGWDPTQGRYLSVTELNELPWIEVDPP